MAPTVKSPELPLSPHQEKAKVVKAKKKKAKKAKLLVQLPSPESTPPPDGGGLATASHSTQSETGNIAEQLKRIQLCPDSADFEILGLEAGASENDLTNAWQRLGCMFHEKKCTLTGSKAAYQSMSR
jgi:hypothetical protein